MIEINKIYQSDCLDFVKQLPVGSVDLIVTDPPYIIDNDGGGGAFGHKKRSYQKKLTNSKETLRDGFNFEVLDEFDRIQKKRNIYIFANKNLLFDLIKYYTDIVYDTEGNIIPTIKNIKNQNSNIDILVYHKTNPTPLCNNKYLSDLEYILFIREEGVKLNGSYSTKSKLYSANIEKNSFNHPTIKPLKLIKNLIENSSNENDLILDCFIGSGTTAVAAKSLNRNFVGCEIDKNYCDIANKRISKVQTSFNFEVAV